MLQLVPPPTQITVAHDTRGLLRAPSKDRALTPIHPGAYVPREWWDGAAPWDRYMARIHAVQLTWSEVTFCLEAAAALLGMPLLGEPKHVHVVGRGLGHTTTKGGVQVHGFAAPRARVTVGGVSVTSPADTVVDLARALPPSLGPAVADAAVRLDAFGVTRRRLDEGLDRLGRTPGAARAQWALEHARAEAESLLESISRAAIIWLGYEDPELQVVFHLEGYTDRVDFYWRRAGVMGESDGHGKYGLNGADAAPQRLIDEKRREDRLRRHARGFARWEWRDVMHPERLDAKLRAAGLVPVRPPQATLLRTLAHNPRAIPDGRHLTPAEWPTPRP